MVSTAAWVSRFAQLNIQWLTGAAPSVFFLYLMAEGHFWMAVPAFFTMALLFFPSTQALFSSVRDTVIGREEQAFFSHFSAEYKQSVKGGGIGSLVWLIWLADFMMLKGFSVVLDFFMIGSLIPLTAVTLYYFLAAAHYRLPVKQVIIKAAVLSIGLPKLTAGMLLLFGLIWYVSVNGVYAVLLFGSGSIAAFLLSSMFYRWYTEMMKKVETERKIA
ncbi:DUF624 domain-containing protein [Alkalicoccus urumqiensis]|uniref:DUF624 domain-containing protein n=1 Tax=Alkalicoccus urumqiensis TaxID=1548213 RepID=A0A2P6MJZ7_ALKUR|nr:DUF624 domain-containing protein [Alkalicoccus urumqiensis]PRO66575.1 hypothetical protein C6I21_04320 [Alkalicoccus urumqiensis]